MRAVTAIALATLALCACETRTVDSEGQMVEETPAPSPCEPAVFEDAPLTDCIADPARHRIRTVMHGADGQPLRSLRALAETTGTNSSVAFAVNGGMFDAHGEAIGYYVEQGERQHRLNQADGPGNFHLLPNGVFFGDSAEGWRVLSTERFADEVEERPDFGTQSGPMLVIGGELHPAFDPDGESRKIRNGVGVDPAGRAHFVISEAPISFGKFARYFRDVLKTPNALFLDGSVSQLWDPARGRLDSGPPLGPMIVVEMREGES